MNKKRLIQQRYPAGMQYINWLQASTQDAVYASIDSGVILNDNSTYKIKTRFNLKELSTQQLFFGLGAGLGGGYVYSLAIGTNLNVEIKGKAVKFTNLNWDNTFELEVEFNATSVSGKMTDLTTGEVKTYSRSDIDGSIPFRSESFYIFGCNGLYRYAAPCRMYYFEIYQDGVKIRDFRPVVNAQNKPMMFCRCTRKFYDNVRDGGSEFFGGVDWIESNGSSYINTGYIEPDDATITIDYSMRFRQKGIPKAIFGASSGGLYNNCICLISENTTYLYMYFATGSNGLSSIENPYYLFNFSHTGQNYIIQRNDITPFNSSRGTTIYNGRPIYLMALNSNGTATSIGNNINYEFFTVKEIANDVETVKLNLEPIVLSDGTGAMFDSVSGTIKGNSGTGTIKWGIKNIYEIDTSTAGSEFLKNGYFDSICKLISFSQTPVNFGLLCIPCQQYLTYSVKKDIASNRYRIMNIFEYPENNVVGDNFISVDVAKTLYENYTTSKDATFLLSWIYNKQYDGEIPSKCWVVKNEEI